MKLKFNFFTLIFQLLIWANASAQTSTVFPDQGSYTKNFKKAEDYLEHGEIIPALNYFINAYKYDSVNANINFKIGSIYLLHPTKKHLAETYLEKAVLNVSEKYKEYDPAEKRAPPSAILDLARAYHLDYKFEKAKEYYVKFEKMIDPRDSFQISILKEFELQTDYALKYTAEPKKINIFNLGPDLNSEYPDFSPVISADDQSIIFTYRGPIMEKDNISPDDGWFYENIVISRRLENGNPGKWSKPELIPNINTPNKHEASVGISADGQTLIIYRDDNTDGNLYYSVWDGKTWGNLTAFGSDINSKYWEPSACISPDGNTLYFVSDRPGGFGGRDLYSSKKLPNGNWGLSVNMGSKINTPFDEESPFVTADNAYLYFSTKGHNSMGGFDIVYTRLYEDGTTDSITNIGYPANSPDDDLYFVVSSDSKRAYYASAHEGGIGEKDIYLLELDLPYPKGLAVLKGKLKPFRKCDEIPNDVVVEIKSTDDGSLIGIYKPKLPSGEFLAVLNVDKEYEISYNKGDTEIKKEKLKTDAGLAYQVIEKEVELPPVNVEANPESIPNSKISLFVNLKDPKDKNLSNKTIKLVSQENTEQLKTNTNGFVAFKNLKANKKYSLVVDEFDEFLAFNDNLDTECLYKNDTIIRIIQLKNKEFITSNTPNTNKNTSSNSKTTDISNSSNSNSNSVGGNNFNKPIKFFFGYNKTNPKYQSTGYTMFFNEIVKQIKPNESVVIELISSASKVPTKKYVNNETLAKIRLEQGKKTILETLRSKGIKNIEFSKEEFGVNGPEYNQDSKNSANIYKEYQFIEIKLEIK